MAGTLFVVATPIGNLEDITLRALRILREVSVIAAEDTRRTSRLLARYGITTPTTSLHEHNERQKSRSLIQRLLAGDNVAVVSDAGTPAISDPGSHLVRIAVDAGIRVEPVPGPSAITAALSVAGRQSDTFTFLGFPPTRSSDRKEWFGRLRLTRGTVVFFEAPHRIRQTLHDVLAFAGDVPALLTRELTKQHEELVRGPISAVIERLSVSRGEYTVTLDIGLSPDLAPAQPPSAATLRLEFDEMTKLEKSTRRTAIAKLAKRHRLSVNEVYSALESAKQSGE